MAMQLATNVLGAFVLRGGKIILQRPFSGDPTDIAAKLAKCRDSFCKEEEELLRELDSTGNKSVEAENPPRFMGAGFKISIVEPKERASVYPIASQLLLNKRDVDTLMGRVNRAMTRASLKEVERDQILMQAVGSLDDLDEAVNRLAERLREWYSLHFPELDDLATSHKVYADLVTQVGARDAYGGAKLAYEPKMNERIKAASTDSLGVGFDEADLKAVSSLSNRVCDLYATKEETEAYIGEMMADIAPNMAELAGPLLGARLINIAHGLKRLSIMPAGTIQILGAEDAFFRFLKTGKKPPKHGVIFQHPDIRGATRNLRGKLARTLAAKIAIAARADAYGGKFIAKGLSEQFQRRVRDLGK